MSATGALNTTSMETSGGGPAGSPVTQTPQQTAPPASGGCGCGGSMGAKAGTGALGSPHQGPGLTRPLDDDPERATTHRTRRAPPRRTTNGVRQLQNVGANGEYAWPTGVRGTLNGRPYQGTHNLGNWQSDNAIDINVPLGTPIIAVADGRITRTGGDNSDPSSQFNGFKATLEGSGNAWYYAHMSRSLVRDGQVVHKGDIIGYSGAANGVPHLHIGQRDGNPETTFGV